MEIKGNNETYNRIQEQAKALFMKYGMRSVSMDDIASELGMSKKTIYQFFADKDQLVEAVVESDIHDMQKDCNFCFNESVNAIDEIFLTNGQDPGSFPGIESYDSLRPSKISFQFLQEIQKKQGYLFVGNHPEKYPKGY
jgi:hypothetical protein